MKRPARILTTSLLFMPALAFAHGEDILLIPFAQIIAIIVFIVFLLVARVKPGVKPVLTLVFIISTVVTYLSLGKIINNYGRFLANKTLVCACIVIFPILAVVISCIIAVRYKRK